MRANNITAIFNRYNFEFWRTAESKTKLPCIIVANLISPRIDYHGHDKSRIDTQPFAKGIIVAARKIAEEVQTFKALAMFSIKNISEHLPLNIINLQQDKR